MENAMADLEISWGGHGGRGTNLKAYTPNLADKYDAMANDGSKSGKAREAAMLFSVAEGHIDNEEDGEALKSANEALALFKSLGDKAGVADTLRIIICAMIYQEKRKEAAAMAKEELEAFKKSGDKLGEAKMLLSLAEANSDCRGSKKRETALSDAEEAKAIFSDKKDTKMEVVALCTLMNIYMKMKSNQEAVKCGNMALSMVNSINDTKLKAIAMHGRASAKIKMSNMEEGMAMAKEALQLFRESGLKKMEAFEMQCLSLYHMCGEKSQDAVSWAEKSMDLYREVKYRKGEVASLATVVQANLACGDALGAVEEAQAALKRSKKMGDDAPGEAAALEMVVLAQIAAGEYNEALSAAEKAMDKFKALGETKWQLNMMRACARLTMNVGQTSKAIRLGQDALKMAEEDGDTRVKATAYRTLADLYLQKPDFDEALKVAKKELDLVKTAGDAKGEADSLLTVGKAHYMKGDYDKTMTVAFQSEEMHRGMGLRHGQAHALNMIAKTHMAKKEYENCLRAAERAARLFKDRGDKGMEAQALLTAASAGVMVCQEGGRGPISSRVYNEQMDKVGRQVKMAVEITESLGDDQLAAYALRASSQVNMIAGKGSEAMVAAEEAARISRSAKDEAAEATAAKRLLPAIDPCNKCGQAHSSEQCPFYVGGRAKHKDAWVNYGRKHPLDMGTSGGNFVLQGAHQIQQKEDGHCLFHSLSYCLKSIGMNGDDNSAMSLRRTIANFILRNASLEIAGDTIEEWVKWDAECSVKSYAHRMAVSGWGGGIEISACSRIKVVNIHVYQLKGEFQRIACFDCPGATQTIHILHSGGVHYDALAQDLKAEEVEHLEKQQSAEAEEEEAASSKKRNRERDRQEIAEEKRKKRAREKAKKQKEQARAERARVEARQPSADSRRGTRLRGSATGQPPRAAGTRVGLSASRRAWRNIEQTQSGRFRLRVRRNGKLEGYGTFATWSHAARFRDKLRLKTKKRRRSNANAEKGSRSSAAEADAEQTERDMLDKAIRLSRLDFEHKSEAAARPAPAAERSVLAFDPEHPLFTIEGAVAACDDNGKLIANLYKEFHEHFSGEPRDASAHGDPDHPGLRAGEAVPEGLKSWDHTSKLRPDGKSKAGGWIASRPAPAQQGTKKVPDTAWFNINVWGSWRLAFLGARLQRELWLREQVQAVGALEAPMAVEATEAVAAPKPAEAPAAAEPTATEAKAAGRSTRGSQSTHSSRGAKGS
mmetsp:Transcript_146202/g.266535  ORF Transcript_146202/g.266535 Transcript_146202/m.266535 type:complete len:1228 (-) Transcript_146202:189-3872(-)